MRVNKEKFENVCKEICTEEWYNKDDYMFIKRDKIITSYLKLQFQLIAGRYFPHTMHKTKMAFPAIVVRRIATKMDLYVTDIVRY